MGAIAHLLEPDQAIKFVMDILKKYDHFESSKKPQNKKLEKIYGFRMINELENYIGY